MGQLPACLRACVGTLLCMLMLRTLMTSWPSLPPFLLAHCSRLPRSALPRPAELLRCPALLNSETLAPCPAPPFPQADKKLGTMYSRVRKHLGTSTLAFRVWERIQAQLMRRCAPAAWLLWAGWACSLGDARGWMLP